MYESPVNIIYGEIQTKIIEEQENQAIQALQNYGISVDKEELIKALMYDRQQYEKGYADAKAEEKWIPCNERLPEDDTEVFVYLFDRPSPFIAWIKDCHWYTEEFEVEKDNYPLAWMPLPDPYKERWEK